MPRPVPMCRRSRPALPDWLYPQARMAPCMAIARHCVRVPDGLEGVVAAPAGVSTGTREVVDVRDGDMSRYAGQGVQRAVEFVAHVNLGGPNAGVLPVPMFNVLNGGKHAPGGPDIQEFNVVPAGAPTFAEALRYSAEIYLALQGLLSKDGFPTMVGDEGGYAPALASNAAALDLVMHAIEAAGYQAGDDVFIALDAAASSFHQLGVYRLEREGCELTTGEMIAYWADLTRQHPIISLEDPLASDDRDGLCTLTCLARRRSTDRWRRFLRDESSTA